MGTVGGSRHFSGRLPDAAVASVWTCPACQQKNTTRFEDGCPGCGTGTAAQAEAARHAAEEAQRARELTAAFATEVISFTHGEMEAALWDLPEPIQRLVLESLKAAVVHVRRLPVPLSVVEEWIAVLTDRLTSEDGVDVRVASGATPLEPAVAGAERAAAAGGTVSRVSGVHETITRPGVTYRVTVWPEHQEMFALLLKSLFATKQIESFELV